MAAIPRVPGGATVGVELCDFHERRELITRTVVVGYWVPRVLVFGTPGGGRPAARGWRHFAEPLGRKLQIADA